MEYINTLKSNDSTIFLAVGLFFGLLLVTITIISQLNAKNATIAKEAQARSFHSSKLASIGELAAGVGHEINNPLTIAIGNLDKLKKIFHEKGMDNAESNNIFLRQTDSLNRIVNIVSGLRIYARFDDDSKEKIDVHDLIEKTIDLIKEMYSKEDITVSVHLNAEKKFIQGNKGRFQQAIMNLISNARDATRNKKDGSIMISTVNVDSDVVVKIIDNGVGIEEDIKNKIFDSFFTTKKIGESLDFRVLIYSISGYKYIFHLFPKLFIFFRLEY